MAIISDIEPIATPAGIGPTPLLSVKAMARHEHAYVRDGHIDETHVHVKADGLAPATDSQLIPASVSAVTNQAQLGMAGRGQSAIEAVDHAQEVGGRFFGRQHGIGH